MSRSKSPKFRLRITRGAPDGEKKKDASGIPGTKAPPPENPRRSATEDEPLVRARSPLAWLRPVLLTLGILSIAGLSLMLAAYRFGQATHPGAEGSATETARPASPEDADQVVKGQGLDFTQTSEGEPVFRIRAEESRQDREGNSVLQTVTLDIFRENGETYTVTSEMGRVNENTWDARLEGDVVLTGWGGFELEARTLTVQHGGQLLQSVGAVEFRYPPDFVGRASSLTVDRAHDSVTLGGGVHLHTAPGAERPMRLDCERLVYHREAGVLRAVGETSLRTEGQSISAHFLTLFMAENGRQVESVRARWNVVGVAESQGAYPAEVTRMEFRGEYLDVQPEPQDPTLKRIKLDGEGDLVHLTITEATGLRRDLSGLYLRALTRDNRLEQIEGVGQPLELVEAIDAAEPFPLRHLCAEQISAFFLKNGDLGRVELENRVELVNPELSMYGGRQATLNVADGLFRIQGAEVHAYNSRAEITAQQFTYAQRTGLIRAYNGVETILAEGATRALASTPLGRGRGPIQVDADEAYWTLEPPTFQFDGNVRAWRGESLILADQLRGDERSREIAAAGSVRSVWVPPEGTPESGPTGESTEPIEVSADRLTYLEETNRLIYNDRVTLRQGRRTMKCRDLEVELVSAGRAKRMTCEGEVFLVDPDSGREVRGDRAVYALAEEKVEITGDRVELIELENQTRLEGRYVLYDLAAGTFTLKSRPPGEDEDVFGSTRHLRSTPPLDTPARYTENPQRRVTKLELRAPSIETTNTGPRP